MRLPGPMTPEDFAYALQAARDGVVVDDMGADEKLDAAFVRVAETRAGSSERIAAVRAAKAVFASL